MAVVQLDSVGRLSMTYVLLFTDDSGQFYRIAGTYYNYYYSLQLITNLMHDNNVMILTYTIIVCNCAAYCINSSKTFE